MEHLSATRVPNKPLRKFAGWTLYDIYLRKFKAMMNSDLFCGVGIALWSADEELIQMTEKAGIPIIQRSSDSAEGRTNKQVFSFLASVGADYILRVNACLPMQKVSTILRMARYFQNDDWIESLEPVIADSGWFWDQDGIPFGSHAQDTKGAIALYRSTQGAHIFNRKLMLEQGKCFAQTSPMDPYLFKIDDPYEAIDVDTEADFEIAEAIFERVGKAKWDEISKP